jgi:hypothetical protein
MRNRSWQFQGTKTFYAFATQTPTLVSQSLYSDLLWRNKRETSLSLFHAQRNVPATIFPNADLVRGATSSPRQRIVVH